MDKLRLYDKKFGKFGFHKNGAGIGDNAYQVRYGSFIKLSALRLSWKLFIRFCVYQENRSSCIVYCEDCLSGFAFIMYPILLCVYPILSYMYSTLLFIMYSLTLPVL